MSEEKSLIKHILMNVFMVTIVIVAVVLMVIWPILCKNYSDKVRAQIDLSVSRKAEELQFEFEDEEK